MKQGTTASGISFCIDEAALDDMELIDALAALDQGNSLAISTASTLLFGKEGKADIYKQLKERNGGRVPATAFANLLQEVFEAIGNEGKK